MDFIISDAELESFIVHRVGNKANDEGFFLAQKQPNLTGELKEILSQYFLNSFKTEEIYRFFHDSDLSMNEVYNYVSRVFDAPQSLKEQSENLAKHLYNASDHPKIKGGEFYVAHFKNCVFQEEITDAIGLFKSEIKDTFLEVEQVPEGFQIDSKTGININKLDKGCLIFNSNKEDGYKIAVVDNTNKGNEAQFWKDDFLHILILNNDFHQTNQFLGITKQFITKQLSEDFDVARADQIDLLNRSVDYFKTHGTFDKQDFEETVFHDEGVIESFRKFNNNFRQEHEVELHDQFDISSQAVKKQSRVFKSVLKLDRNFHIYIHGDRKLIEQGIDESGRKFYKIFYEVES